MSRLLTTASLLQCPHLGAVQPQTSNTRVSFDGAQALRASDIFPIVGCIFSTSGGPHPCVRVEWQTTTARSSAVGDATLAEDSLGFCYAADGAMQGAVLVLDTQPRVMGV